MAKDGPTSIPSHHPDPAQKRCRASTKRSRAGCRTCRTRRIKCDETKPSCRQCIRGKRKCDGYTEQSHFFQQCTSSFPLNLLKQLVVTQTLPQTTSYERRSFEYFCQRTIPELRGYFESSFWDRFVLQTSQHEPAILHAAVALGALHEAFETHSGWIPGSSSFALEQYDQSIRTLSKTIRENGKLAMDIALMTCILYVCLEMLLGHHAAAIAHIESGAKILLEYNGTVKDKPSSTSSLIKPSIPYVPPSTLHLIFVRLDFQASQILSKRPLYLHQESLDEDSCFHSQIPPMFTTLNQARNAMDYLRNCVMRSLESITQAEERFKPPFQPFYTNRRICAVNLQRWSSAFEAFLRKYSQNLDVRSEQSIHLLKIHRIMIGMNLDLEDLDTKWTETAYDSYILEFEAILTHASLIINYLNKTSNKIELDPKQVMKKRFTLEPGLIPALFFVTTKCRHGIIRRKALSLLSTVPTQEGLWDSVPLSKVLQKYIEIEEEGLSEVEVASDVPDWKRLSGVDARFDLEERKVVVQYQRIWGVGDIRLHGLKECIMW